MKIIVAATRHPHALSRRQVENLFTALPAEFAAQIHEFVLSNVDRWPEPFAYVAVKGRQRVEFAMIVRDKTPETTERALREVLLGLARMQAGAKFRPPARPE